MDFSPGCLCPCCCCSYSCCCFCYRCRCCCCWRKYAKAAEKPFDFIPERAKIYVKGGQESDSSVEKGGLVLGRNRSSWPKGKGKYEKRLRTERRRLTAFCCCLIFHLGLKERAREGYGCGGGKISQGMEEEKRRKGERSTSGPSLCLFWY